jgi:hypothetical protein
MNGRYVISNIQEPHAGFVDTSDVTKFKEAVIEKVLSLKKVTEINRRREEILHGNVGPWYFSKEIKNDMLPPWRSSDESVLRYSCNERFGLYRRDD